MSTHNLCFEQKYEKHQNFLSGNFPFLAVKFSLYLNRRVFVMQRKEIFITVPSFNVFSCLLNSVHRFSAIGGSLDEASFPFTISCKTVWYLKKFSGLIEPEIYMIQKLKDILETQILV